MGKGEAMPRWQIKSVNVGMQKFRTTCSQAPGSDPCVFLISAHAVQNWLKFRIWAIVSLCVKLFVIANVLTYICVLFSGLCYLLFWYNLSIFLFT